MGTPGAGETAGQALIVLFEITHRSHYQYTQPVFFEPLTLRLRPRCDATQIVRTHDLRITPSPTGISYGVGLDGNGADTVWFDGVHDQLDVVATSVVETRRSDPFGFLITDAAAVALPIVYDARLRASLGHYLERPVADDAVQQFSAAIQKGAGHKTVPFLILLAERIYKEFQYLVREHGAPWTPRETLANKRGACRDYALLYLDACRCAGLAARFVSGYCYTDVPESNLHAWAEVYLPGAGWRGFDPTEGLAVAERHVAVAAGRDAPDASPTHGHFRGAAEPTLTATISIKRLNN